MMRPLDAKPSPKTLIVFIVAGAVLFLPAFAAGNFFLRSGGGDPDEFREAWLALDGPRTASWYAGARGALPAELAGCAGLAGYALFGFGAGVFLARKLPSGRNARGARRALARLSYAASFIAPAAAFFDLFGRIVVISAQCSGTPIPAVLLAPTLLALNLKGIVWIAFLWMLFLAVFLLAGQWAVKRKIRRRPPD